MADLTVLDLDSDPRERGRVHGRAMRDEIRDNYRIYVERFEAGGAKLPVVLEQSDAWAERSLPAIIPSTPKRWPASRRERDSH